MTTAGFDHPLLQVVERVRPKIRKDRIVHRKLRAQRFERAGRYRIWLGRPFRVSQEMEGELARIVGGGNSGVGINYVLFYQTLTNSILPLTY